MVPNVVTGELHVHDFNEEAPVVFLTEHYALQLSILKNTFPELHQKEWLVSHPEHVERSYPKNHATVLEGAKKQHQTLAEEAKRQYFTALGYYAVLDSAEVTDITPYEREANQHWTIFQARFRSLRKTQAREAEIASLTTKLEELNHSRTLFNREYGLRPHAPSKAKVRRTIKEPEPIKRTLSTRERLVAIREDPRAGFLPTTNREKNQVLTYLDYLDNPEYPFGAANQIFEVFIHQQRLKNDANGLDLAREASVSIPYEIGDYYQDALKSVAALRQLETEIRELPNRRIALPEDIGDDHPAFPALIRYRDLVALAVKGRQPQGIKDVLLTREDRQPQLEPQKNKVVGDMYTSTARTEAMDKYITDQVSGMTANQALVLVVKAITDQTKRAMFMKARLEEFGQTEGLGRNFQSWRVAKFVLAKTLVTVE